MTDRALMLRAGVRVLLRVVAKGGVYLAVALGALAVHRWYSVAVANETPGARIIGAVVVVGWIAAALVIGAAKTREEAQRLRRHP